MLAWLPYGVPWLKEDSGCATRPTAHQVAVPPFLLSGGCATTP